MTKKFESVNNPLSDEPVVVDIIAEYNSTIDDLNKVIDVVESYKKGEDKNKQIEKDYREILGEHKDNPDELKDDEDVNF